MQSTIEEILEMVSESIGACFFIALMLYFTMSGRAYSLGYVVSLLMANMMGG